MLQRIAPRKVPSLRQLRYLPRILQPGERRLLAVALVVLIASASLFGARMLFRLTAPVAKAGGTYTEGLIGTPRFINSILASGNDVDRDIASLVFSGLMTTDTSGNIIPDLASQLRVTADQKEFTVELKDDLYWHDGEPLTVDDIIYTIQMIQDPALKNPYRLNFSQVTVQAIDRTTVSFILPEPSSSFLTALTVGIMPKHIWYPIPSAQATLAEANIKPIGSGPYQFKSLTKDANGAVRNITLERYTKYHGEPPYIDTITFKFYPDVLSAIEALKNKNIEGIGFLPLELKEEIDGISSIEMHLLDLPQHRALFFNPDRNELLGDKNIRRALGYGVDRERIIAEALNGNGNVIASPILPGLISDPELSETYAYNPATASAILEEDGWTLDEESAIRRKDDIELRIQITTINQPDNVRAVEIIKENWEALGIATDLVVVAPEKIKKDVIESRNYQTLLFGQITTSIQDVYAFWHSSQTQHPGNNLAIFANKDIDATLEALRNESDPFKQDDLYTEFSRKLSEEAFAIFLYTPVHLYPVTKKVHGIQHLQHVSSPSDRFSTINEWYIKTKRQWK